MVIHKMAPTKVYTIISLCKAQISQTSYVAMNYANPYLSFIYLPLIHIAPTFIWTFTNICGIVAITTDIVHASVFSRFPIIHKKLHLNKHIIFNTTKLSDDMKKIFVEPTFISQRCKGSWSFSLHANAHGSWKVAVTAPR